MRCAALAQALAAFLLAISVVPVVGQEAPTGVIRAGEGMGWRYYPRGISGCTAGRKAWSWRTDGLFSADRRTRRRATRAEECNVSDYTELSTLS